MILGAKANSAVKLLQKPQQALPALWRNNGGDIMTINGTYIHARGTPPSELALMQRAVIHYFLATAWAKERLGKGTGRNWNGGQQK